MSNPVKSERVPRFSPLGELLLGVGVFVGGWILYGIGRVLPLSSVQAVILLAGYVVIIVGVVLLVTGIIRVVRGRNARHELADRAAHTVIGGGQANELDRLASLHDSGALSDDEFTAAKRQLLGL